MVITGDYKNEDVSNNNNNSNSIILAHLLDLGFSKTMVVRYLLNKIMIETVDTNKIRGEFVSK